MEPETDRAGQAVRYQAVRRRLTLFHLFLTPALLLTLLLSGLTFGMRINAWALTGGNEWGVVAVYFLLFTIYFLIFDLPLEYYSGFVLEHSFGLSNQTVKQWAVDFLKKAGLSFGLSLMLLEFLYWVIRQSPLHWWLWAWAGYAFVSYILGKLFPVIIVPLFYKYGKMEDRALETKVLALAARFGLPVQNVYSLNLSKTTKKANAAFMGMGRTKRVVLSDTLIEQFTHPEVEIVVAHELGHYKHHDVWRLLGLGLAASFLAFAAGYWGVNFFTRSMQLGSAANVAGLPLLLVIFYVVNLFLMPLQNAYSRHRENEADRFALEACGNKYFFISCMRKLGEQNLADPEPPSWYEWIFYDHPSLGKRIARAEKYNA